MTLVGLVVACALALAVEASAQCAPAPQAGCLRVAAALDSQVRLKTSPTTPARKDIKWVWKRGPQTPVPQLGSPETGADNYALCIYDTGALVSQVDIPGGPLWLRKVNSGGDVLLGFKNSSRPYAPHGVRTLKLVNYAGNAAGISLKASRDLVPIPALPLTMPEAVTIQLVNTAGGCWEGNYFAGTHQIRDNSATVFKAIGD